MTETIRYSKIGREDLAIGSSTFQVTLADGSTVTLSQVEIPEYKTDTGAANAYVVATNEQTPYRFGFTVWFIAAHTNTTASTLNINSLGTKSIKKNSGVALEAGDILAGQVVVVVYDGSVFQLINSANTAVANFLTADNVFTGQNTFSDTTEFTADVTVSADIAVTGNAAVTGDVAGATATISGDGSVGGDLGVGGDIALTGSMTSGAVPLARMKRTEAVATSAGATLTTPAATTIVSLASMDVISGDRILVGAEIAVTKGGTAGATSYSISKSAGTATIATFNAFSTIDQAFHHIAGTGYTNSLFGIIKITGSGTLTLKLTGISAGSDATVPVNFGQIYALVLNNG